MIMRDADTGKTLRSATTGKVCTTCCTIGQIFIGCPEIHAYDEGLNAITKSYYTSANKLLHKNNFLYASYGNYVFKMTLSGDLIQSYNFEATVNDFDVTETGVVFAAHDRVSNHSVTSFAASGSLLATHDTGNNTYCLAISKNTTIYEEYTIVIGGTTVSSKNIWCLYLDFSVLLWDYYFATGSAEETPVQAEWDDAGNSYFIARKALGKNFLFSLDVDGVYRWVYPTGGFIILGVYTANIAVIGDYVYIIRGQSTGSTSGVLGKINRTTGAGVASFAADTHMLGFREDISIGRIVATSISKLYQITLSDMTEYASVSLGDTTCDAVTSIGEV